MSEENKAIAKTEASPLTILNDPEKLKEIDVNTAERLWAMHKEFEAERAKRAFIEAFHKVQSSMTPVVKNTKGAHGYYAKAEKVKEMLDPLLKENGFTYSFDGRPTQRSDHTLFVLTLSHKGGHEVERTLEAPVDYGQGSVGSRTKVQGMGSTVTYCTRYLLCMVFGVLLTDDNDGNAIRNAEAISEEQADIIWHLLDETDTDVKKFTDHFKVDKVEDLPQGHYNKAVGLLNKKKKTMRIIECEQGSQKWHESRMGIPTASEFSKILTPSGKLSTSCEGYLGELLAEWVLGEPAEQFETEWMARGKMLEPEAFTEYAFLHDIEPKQVGFCLHDEFDAGASPDALVGDDGLLEFKCPMAGKHLVYLFRNELPKQYILQVQGQLWVTGRSWCDFTSYHPELPLFVKRVLPDEKIQTALDMWVEHFLKELELGKQGSGNTGWFRGRRRHN